MSAKIRTPLSRKRRTAKLCLRGKKDVDTIFGYLRNIRKQPVTLQIAVGVSGGMVTGYLFSKTSRFVAVLTGCSLILLQFFNYRGYLKFNRSQLRKDLDDLQDTVRAELGLANKLSLPSGKELADFLSKNANLLLGFVAGNLIAIWLCFAAGRFCKQERLSFGWICGRQHDRLRTGMNEFSENLTDKEKETLQIVAFKAVYNFIFRRR